MSLIRIKSKYYVYGDLIVGDSYRVFKNYLKNCLLEDLLDIIPNFLYLTTIYSNKYILMIMIYKIIFLDSLIEKPFHYFLKNLINRYI
jgi:hypothetical protein